MKINDSNRISGTGSYQKQSEMRASGARKAKSKDEVQISAAAKEMLSANGLQGAERAKQIDQLKRSITSGNYHVEAGKIAEKLLPYLKE
nr:flagellar biosynthesis anti-sigma factor FlgM [Paenibacillus sp. HB172176]